MKKYYSFLYENGMCAAGLTAYESPATNNGTFQDVYCHDKKKKKSKKQHKRISIPNPLKDK